MIIKGVHRNIIQMSRNFYLIRYIFIAWTFVFHINFLDLWRSLIPGHRCGRNSYYKHHCPASFYFDPSVAFMCQCCEWSLVDFLAGLWDGHYMWGMFWSTCSCSPFVAIMCGGMFGSNPVTHLSGDISSYRPATHWLEEKVQFIAHCLALYIFLWQFCFHLPLLAMYLVISGSGCAELCYQLLIRHFEILWENMLYLLESIWLDLFSIFWLTHEAWLSFQLRYFWQMHRGR